MLICKTFGDDASLFSKIKDKSFSTAELDNDLKIISNWAIQWKMLLNPDPIKQAVEIIFSKKMKKTTHHWLLMIITYKQILVKSI